MATKDIKISGQKAYIESELLDKMNEIVQMDIDAVFAYEQAIDRIDIEVIKSNLISFREDHERHVLELSNIIYGYGGTPPTFDRGFKGFVIQGFTMIRSLTGNEGALKAMRGNEFLTNQTYQRALNWGNLPADLRDVLERNFEDERRHLTYIEEALQRLTAEASPKMTTEVHPELHP